MDKKAQISKTVEAGAILVVIVIVLFAVYSALVPEAQKAGDSMNVSNRCASAGCFYNTTDNLLTSADCRNNLSNTSLGCPNEIGTGIPLSGLFKGSGIVFLLIMVGLLFTILRVVLPSKKK